MSLAADAPMSPSAALFATIIDVRALDHLGRWDGSKEFHLQEHPGYWAGMRHRLRAKRKPNINNVLVTGCTITNNSGGGIQAGVAFNDPYHQHCNDSNMISENAFGHARPTIPPMGSAILLSEPLGATAWEWRDHLQQSGRRQQCPGDLCLRQSAYTIVKGNTVTGTVALSGNTRTGGGIYIDASPQLASRTIR